MSAHPNLSSGEISTAEQAQFQELDASQPAPQQSQQIAQELPTTQPDIDIKEHPVLQKQPPTFDDNAIKSESDIYPTVAQQQPPTSNHNSHKSESDIYPTVVSIGSDEFPTPVSSPAPTLPNSAPRYSMSYGHEGYYAPDKSAYNGNNAGAGMGGQPAYYQQQQQQLPYQTAPHDASNPVVAHGGVVPIQQQSRKKYVNVCGTMFAQKTVIVLGSVAAMIAIIVIGVGAGLGAKKNQNQSMYYY